MRRDKTRLEGNSRIGWTGTRLLLYGPVARENLEKIRKKFRTGRDYSIFQYPTGNFPSSTEFWEFFPKFSEISNLGIPVSFLGLRRDGNLPVQMAGLRQEREEDVHECSGRDISQIFQGKFRFPGNGIRERRPLLSNAS